MQETFYIVDGMALAYRSYFALGRLSTAEGKPTGAIYGSAMFLNKLISEETPDYLAIVTDAGGKTFRHEIFKDYKGTRDKMPDELREQIAPIYELFELMGATPLRIEGVEADDVIGTMAKKWATPKRQVYIVSGDKDFMQLIDPNIKLYAPKRNEEILIVDESGVREKFLCAPNQVIEALALIGDSSDNVPGVKGIGEKGAAKLIESYGSLEGIYQNLDAITAKKQREGLAQHREEAFLSRDLVTIKTDVDIDFELEDFRCRPEQAAANDALLQFYDEHEFRQLAARVRTAIGKTPAVSGSRAPATVGAEIERRYQVVDSSDKRDELVTSLANVRKIGLALHSKEEDRLARRAVGFAISTGPGKVFFLPAEHDHGLIAQILSDRRNEISCHGVKESLHTLSNDQIEVDTQLFDTKIADYLLDPNNNNHNLDSCVVRHLGETRALEFERAEDLDPEIFVTCEDADFALRLLAPLTARLNDSNMTGVFREVELPLATVLAHIERNGVFIDTEFLASYSNELDIAAKSLIKKIHDHAGEEFNINSTKQLQKILFDKLKVHEELGVKRLKKTKTGYSTDESVLKRLSAHPIPRLILEYRLVAKLKNTYVDTLPQHVSPVTGRLHTRLRQTVAATGRLSSDNPNLQNVPMRTELGRKIRRAFRPMAEGDLIISADYSQVEIRLLAHLAKAEDLIKAFREGLDIHTVTAAKIFGLSEKEVSPDLRSQAKAVNFGIIYGMGPQRLAQETGVSLSEAKEFIARYFDAFPSIKTYTESLIGKARQLGYSETMTGRRRPIVGINESNRAMQARAENIAVNSPIQGSAADLIKLAMIKIDAAFRHRGFGAKMLLQVHDELMFSCPRAEVDEVSQVIRDCMENALVTSVPLKVEIGYGANWLEAH